ncbi:hypothetical protein [Streptomyces cinnamoneus]|uniref:Uncharacterized protein n=1 Tax=Streptomyces cinnamoneus TaxID=53446 RepID=A0A918WRR9_STRCJ|nr:hypothetical protein [Streptomyces cinnamoneus]GHC75038.1 hypothetical protein GCM10010507_63050 [Streptomyces cinnamoneus]
MAEKCAGMYDAWRRSEVSKRLDVLEGFLGSRPPYRNGAEAREWFATTVALAREALAEDDLDLAGMHLVHLQEESEEWADDPHCPFDVSAYEADAQVRDLVKDELRGRVSVKRRDDRKSIQLSIGVTRNKLLYKVRGLTCSDRHDVHYLSGRATMALDLGHMDAARREVDRLRKIEKRYDGKGEGGAPTPCHF